MKTLIILAAFLIGFYLTKRLFTVKKSKGCDVCKKMNEATQCDECGRFACKNCGVLIENSDKTSVYLCIWCAEGDD